MLIRVTTVQIFDPWDDFQRTERLPSYKISTDKLGNKFSSRYSCPKIAIRKAVCFYQSTFAVITWR